MEANPCKPCFILSKQHCRLAPKRHSYRSQKSCKDKADGHVTHEKRAIGDRRAGTRPMIKDHHADHDRENLKEIDKHLGKGIAEKCAYVTLKACGILHGFIVILFLSVTGSKEEEKQDQYDQGNVSYFTV